MMRIKLGINIALSVMVMFIACVSVTAQTTEVTIYDDGVSPNAEAPRLKFGDHLVGAASHPSVAGTGRSGISNDADALNGSRSFTYDTSAQADLTDGITKRDDTGFAMLIWDMGSPLHRIRFYSHQDNFSGELVTDNSTGQELMEYSVWGSHNGDDFVLLSDVVGLDINGGGVGIPTYTFSGTAPSVVYRGGSSEFGIVNAYTREYVFDTAYQYYGVRTSQISLTIPGGGVDADPEIDAVAGILY